MHNKYANPSSKYKTGKGTPINLDSKAINRPLSSSIKIPQKKFGLTKNPGTSSSSWRIISQPKEDIKTPSQFLRAPDESIFNTHEFTSKSNQNYYSRCSKFIIIL